METAVLPQASAEIAVAGGAAPATPQPAHLAALGMERDGVQQARPGRRILRPLFRPLRLPSLLAALLARSPRAEASAWVLAAAAARLARSPRPGAPPRWYAALAAAFPTNDSGALAECRVALENGLPDAACESDALLGELLLAARATERDGAQPARVGRAGRRSIPEVYTPPELADAMVAALHLGPRRLLDPACGAGVFLLSAFRRACRRRVAGGQSPRDAARAALAHEISGIDLDGQALALARFSLRVAAWETAGLDEDAPLDLRQADALGPLAGLDGRADVVVGNPPFVEGRGLSRARLAWLRTCYRCAASGKINLFAVFVERGLTLLRPGGVLCFILPVTFQRNERYRPLRELLLEHTLEAITPVPAEAFPNRVVETVILRVRKAPPLKSWHVALPGGRTLQGRLALGPARRFTLGASNGLRRQVARMDRRGVPLETCFEVRDGISTGFQPFPRRLLGRVVDGAFVAADGTRVPFDPQRHVRVIDGREFNAFTPVRWAGRWLEYDKAHEHAPPHPGRAFNCQLRERAIYDRPEKLLTRQTGRALIATLDRERFFVRNSVHVTYPRPELHGEADLSLAALCVCLNSRFYAQYFVAATGEDGRYFPQVHIADLRRLPILPELLERGGDLERLVERLFELHAAADTLDVVRLARLEKEVDDILRAAFNL